MSFLSEHKEIVAKAHVLAAEHDLIIQKQTEEMDNLLEKICLDATDLPLEELEEFTNALPKGFYRTELKAWIKQRKGI